MYTHTYISLPCDVIYSTTCLESINICTQSKYTEQGEHTHVCSQYIMYRCMCAVGVWTDVELNSRITERSADINDFLDSVPTNKSASVRVINIHVYRLVLATFCS